MLPITTDTDLAFVLKQKTTHRGLSFAVRVNLFHLCSSLVYHYLDGIFSLSLWYIFQILPLEQYSWKVQ